MKKLIILLVIAFLCPFGSAQLPGVSTNGNITTSGSACTTAGACVTLALPKNTAAVAIVVSGTFSGTLQFEESSDSNTSIVALPCSPQPSGANVTSTTAVGTWICPTSGMTNAQIRASAFASGSAVVTINSTSATPGNANQSISIVNSGDPCQDTNIVKSSAAINISSATTTQLVAPSGSTAVFVCGFDFTISQVVTTANTLQFEAGTGATCGAATVAKTGLYGSGGVTAGIPIHVQSAGSGTVFQGAAASGVCAVTAIGASGSFQGIITFVQQ